MNLSSRTAYGQFTPAEDAQMMETLIEMVQKIRFVVQMDHSNIRRLIQSQGTKLMQFWWDRYLTGDDQDYVCHILNQRFPLQVRTA